MKKLSLFIVLLLLNSSLIFSQVGVNMDGSAPDASSILDLATTEKGFLLPRMTTNQLSVINDPATGLIVFNLDSLDLYIYKGSYWVSVLKCDNRDTIFPWTCGAPITVNHVAGTVAPVNKTVTYGTVTSIPGEPSKCWITSNLGADHQATAANDATEASAGWYWQFNRMQGYKHDGSALTPSWTITGNNENSDWIAANDPCALLLGSGWRLPTLNEWTNVDASGDWTDWNGPWNSALKIHAAGFLYHSDGSLLNRGYDGCYWSSSQSPNNEYGMRLLFFTFTSACYVGGYYKADGYISRCIKE